MHEAFKIIGLLFPLALLAWLFFFSRGLRLPDLRSHEQTIEQIRSDSRSVRAEQLLFQEELLTELKRHNTAMERQSELLTRLLERLDRDRSA
jgi:hypothetical protein